MAYALLPMAAVQCGRILAVGVLAFAAACSSSAHDPGVSPGTVTVRLLLPPARSFCDTITCSPLVHVVIGTESGNWLAPTPGPCGAPVPCANACVPLHPCTAGLCPPNTNYGLPIASVETTWDGSYAESSTCSNGAACYNTRFVAPGRYVARLCATPGDLIVTDSPDAPTCAPTGPEECVETPFDLPGPPQVEVSLPGQGR